MIEAPGASICVVVLTLNESAVLPRCLPSLQWADDLVVVDSGSTDGSRDVAAAHGARVLLHEQDGPFLISEQRNWALDNAETDCDWVVFFDADEAVGPELARFLRHTLSFEQEFDAFEMTPRYWFLGAWMRRSLGYPNWHPRVVRARTVRFAGGVWEHFADRARVGRIDLPYEHYGNAKGFSDWLQRHDRYSTWDARSVSEYLISGDPGAFGTNRKLRLRRIASRLWWFRPPTRFVTMYLLRRGFLDGWPALLFCMRYAIYEYMTVEKTLELRRNARKLPL